MRTISLPIDFVDLRKAPIDIHEIENNVRDFYLCLDINPKENIKTQCLDAKSFLDSARVLVRNLVSIEENDLIKPYNKAYIFMQENLGRVDKKITAIEDENLKELMTHERYQGQEIVDSPFMRRYINSLINSMNHLVYHPLKNALKKYNEVGESGGKKIVKNKDLYLYFLFIELLHSSESLGSITAEDKITKTSVISHNRPIPNEENKEYKEYNPTEDNPPAIPENVETEGDSGIWKTAEEYFSEDEETLEEPSEDTIFEDEDIQVTEEKENGRE